MITSKITAEGQTTIPQSVRMALGVRLGDELVYVIKDGRVLLNRKIDTPVTDDPFAAFVEWGSAAYADV